MPNFAYQAVDRGGKRQRGNANAVSIGALTSTLEQRGLFVLDVAETPGVRRSTCQIPSRNPVQL